MSKKVMGMPSKAIFIMAIMGALLIYVLSRQNVKQMAQEFWPTGN